MTAYNNHIEPRIGEGVYLIKDVAKILGLDYELCRRWINGYWDGNLRDNFSYVFGEKGNKAINFYSLIEFYTFYKLREKNIGASAIRKLHKELAEKYNSDYPFALAQDFYIEDRKYKKLIVVDVIDGYYKNDGKKKLYLKFYDDFLEKVEFDKDNFARRYYPLGKEKNVVVDPLHQFGQPIIKDTNIKTQTIYSLYKGGETNENICILYNLPIEKVQDAINFHENAA